MSDNIKIEALETHLNVVIDGSVDVDKGKDVLRQIMTSCKKYGLNKVLIDASGIEKDLSLMTRFDLARFAVEEQTNPIRLAIVGPARMLTNGSVFEDVADNSGGVVKVTADPREAHDWLLGS
jgi:hypothetical protein